jgi:hypothetical protein
LNFMVEIFLCGQRKISKEHNYFIKWRTESWLTNNWLVAFPLVFTG